MAQDLISIGSDGWFRKIAGVPSGEEILLGGWFIGVIYPPEHLGFWTDGWFWTDGAQPDAPEIMTFGVYTESLGTLSKTAVLTYYYDRLKAISGVP